jgi:DNA-binding transcriptional regulator GbsR (MarR family)
LTGHVIGETAAPTGDQESVAGSERIRREFAAAWGAIGAAWGVAPSTATVQGYFLVHGGPLSEPEIRRALGLSHRAASLALLQCEEWGLIERSDIARRSGQRGPAAAAWRGVGNHWEWFRRVAEGRKQREMDPVLPVIERCAAQAADAAADSPADAELTALRDRIGELLAFVRRFDHGVGVFVRGEPRAIERVFIVLEHLEPRTVERLWKLVDSLEPSELESALDALAQLPPAAIRRLVGLAGQPALRKLLGIS